MRLTPAWHASAARGQNFLDASFFRMHPGSRAEPVLAACGITTAGKPVFVGLAPASGESADGWLDVLADLKDRGLASPLR